MEDRAHPLFALDPDPALHQLNRFPNDRESQTGTTMLPGVGLARLSERLKDQILRRRCDADASIANVDAERVLIVARTDGNATIVCEQPRSLPD